MEELLLKHNIPATSLFTLVRFDSMEGLIFFEYHEELDEDEKVVDRGLLATYIVIDDAKFVYEETIDDRIKILTDDENRAFIYLMDGRKLEIMDNDKVNFPFKFERK